MFLKLNFRSWIYFLLPSMFILSCSEVRLIGAYDQAVDEGIQKVAKDISRLVIKLEKNFADGNDAANAYSLFREDYIDIEGEIQTLKIRAGALPKYEKVKAQIDLLKKNVQNFEALHKSNFVLPGRNPGEALKAAADLFEIGFTAMIAAQNSLKREKIN